MNANRVLKSKITVHWLKKHGACPEQVDIFKQEWGAVANLTVKNIYRAMALKLDLDWFALHYLSIPAWKIYQESKASAEKIYQESIASLRVYQESKASAEKIYQESKASALKIYQESKASALIKVLEKGKNEQTQIPR